jgi:hypothetical protein
MALDERIALVCERMTLTYSTTTKKETEVRSRHDELETR